MKNKLSVLFGLLLIASMVLSACGGGGAANATGEVTFWHAYGTGSAEEVALAKLLEQAKTDMPDVTINVLQVPFN
ncbi:MAG: extracellular solute-binding protein, partial [Anaerolineales bacterium]